MNWIWRFIIGYVNLFTGMTAMMMVEESARIYYHGHAEFFHWFMGILFLANTTVVSVMIWFNAWEVKSKT